MIRSFPNIVKQILKYLPTNDYPVLHSCLFFQIWLTFILDKSLTSMRDLFYLLNRSGINVHISTFSKACKQRCDQYFRRIYTQLRQQLIRNNPTAGKMLFPIDATVVSLTSKLFWAQGQHQVKLLNGVNLSQGYVSECLIHFGQGHDAKFTDYIAGMIPENGIGIMDRGFASWELLDELSATNTLFVVRIKNNMRTELNHSRYRVIWFCDVERRTEFRLATNLPAEEFSNGEIADIYRCRWQIELLWKFLKMHLKLDKLITKSRNGVMLQIYMILIGYMILQLMEIPVFYGDKLLDKLRYLQLELRQRCSVIHWSYDFLPEALVA